MRVSIVSHAVIVTLFIALFSLMAVSLAGSAQSESWAGPIAQKGPPGCC